MLPPNDQNSKHVQLRNVDTFCPPFSPYSVKCGMKLETSAGDNFEKLFLSFSFGICLVLIYLNGLFNYPSQKFQAIFILHSFSKHNIAFVFPLT